MLDFVWHRKKANKAYQTQSSFIQKQLHCLLAGPQLFYRDVMVSLLSTLCPVAHILLGITLDNEDLTVVFLS